MKHDYAEYVPVLKALSDETRLRILNMVSCGEMCACRILEEFNITQPTLSYHMKILTESGLVDARRDGAWMRYTLNRDRADEVRSFISDIFLTDEDCNCKDCGFGCGKESKNG
ncbi:MAG: winged helix-turn-helix transcriptional regulator [Clostridia bacterium]|nr:winged helix-turn-helix transcriptional regulator [Clostridia bacterium]